LCRQDGKESRANIWDKGKCLKPRYSIHKNGGEIKIKRTLRTTAGALLILMLASGAQAATVVFGATGFMRGTETRTFPFEIIEGGHFKATLSDFNFPASFDDLAPAIFKGREIIGNPLLGAGMFQFQAGPGIFSANVLGIAGGDSDLSLFRVLDLILSRLKASDEPMPVAAVLILVGLIGLIALKGRRK
jgi:hypothetical protein